MPAVNESTMIDSKGEVVTDFIDSVGTSSVSYTYTNTQTSLYIRNDSDVSITVTVGGSPTVIARYADATITAEYSSFSIVSASGIAAFYARSIRGVTTNNVSATSLNIVSGSATSPSISAIGDANTGMFFPASETVAFTTNGTEKVRINSDGQLVTRAGTVSLPAIAPTGDSDTGILFPAAGRISLTSNGTEVVYCHSNLNVAVGHNAPTSKLDVAGAIAVRGSALAGAFITISPDITTGTNGTIISNSFASGGYGPLYIQNGGSTRFTVLSGGNVGIGTTSPPELLTLSGGGLTILGTNSSINYDGISMDFNSTSREARIAVGGTSGQNGFLTFTTSNAGTEGERMRITAAGNVGIGETNPQTELHITGTGEIVRLETTTARGSGSNYLSFYDPTGVKANFGFPNADDNFWFINSLNGDMNFGTNNTNRMKIEAGGTVRPHANNTYDLGSSSFRWATIYAQNALNVSDARLKTDVQDSTLGLDFISSLRPVQYKFIEGRNEVTKDEEGNDVVTPIPGIRTHFGLIAQEVKDALPTDLDFAGWCLADKEDSSSTQSLGYTELIAPMIKAIQELTEKVEALEAQLNQGGA